MARRKTLVKDIDTTDLDRRHPSQLLLTPDTEQALADLVNALSMHRHIQRDVPRPMSKKESDSAFQEWVSCAPRATRRCAAEISLSESREKALGYLRKQFYLARPECIPNRKQGRPAWFVPPQTRNKVLAGEILAMLINAAGHRIMDELEGKQDAA